ncbi:MAG: hypothetical protein COV26_01295 [Candidatus Nealsonbacteria bacterium CG10_big_fil_rev_8_21_14_0_10_36_23]|uniref:Uncharacterized protein n=1 Tax=Candidatus Nealsonbacteria bacterium CG10_big_fil_rev_8_21_14_0_10_36_23 TaxID=1974709 RepID=A0A2H0TL91_9BACT|nr:MAG: hypothetical protein COV26_01295 [Candidatus Nealsonbacteria bacterium CG10_big_fil_rev_8_21_14_0_10_36_23]
MKTRDLEKVKAEVENIRDHSGKVDEKIKPLVIGLREWGVKTISSCQGHKRSVSEVLLFPSIIIPSQDAKKVRNLISVFKKNSWVLQRETWVNSVGKRRITLRLVPWNKKRRKLNRMQKDAIEFGLFLQQLPDDFFKEAKND